jgi:hypothetical protein
MNQRNGIEEIADKWKRFGAGNAGIARARGPVKHVERGADGREDVVEQWNRHRCLLIVTVFEMEMKLS